MPALVSIESYAMSDVFIVDGARTPMGGLLGDLADAGVDPDTMRSPEQLKRETIKRISEINKRLEDIIAGDEGKTAETLQRTLSQLQRQIGRAHV